MKGAARIPEDRYWMEQAVALAALGTGTTRPNPMVGAVVVKDGILIGCGYHRRAGGDHAEVVALRAAGARARGATLYANLEPCIHHGKTPPCTDAILEAGIGRVVTALEDPTRRWLDGGSPHCSKQEFRSPWVCWKPRRRISTVRS